MVEDGFFDRLNYSSVNEDWRAEVAGLRPRPEDRVLCITGSGDRPLDLLAEAPLRVVALDRSPAQNHLLRLKIGAMRTLGFENYTRFLGLEAAAEAERLDVWSVMRPSLDRACRSWWDAREEMIAGGVLYSGRFERHIRRLGAVMRALRPTSVRSLLEARDLVEQASVARETWDRAWWRGFMRVALSPVVSRLLLGDPAFYRRTGVSPGRCVHEGMLAALVRWPARSSFMVGFILTGRIPGEDLPPYLSRAGFETIRERLDRIEIVDADVNAYLEGERGRFEGFSLSDIPSYLDASGWTRLVRLVGERAAPGARVVIRRFLTRDPWPGEVAPRLVRSPEIERRLEELDRSFVYRFFVAEATG